MSVTMMFFFFNRHVKHDIIIYFIGLQLALE
jgi:hypothetical protein